ncbi:hypothetical protein SAMN05216421_2685 [Halopseudomonas xinjiangensis]|uniref:SPOR domain-containing protein n=1 Tax=Halopseudomonas xinjiangensis TaxID=487184 RepID=A0A1H1WW55_9GAMM|nr:SPOR domain-containing protein [Halopseudomonas xinjiangensis]SDT00910.1 hypothetical protein SAMN05216421_2685 [Halopseudomonas xinjiangensis]
MRSLFLLLLLLNILYALWQLQDGMADRALRDQADRPLEQRLVSQERAKSVEPSAAAQNLEQSVNGTVLCVSLGAFDERGRAEQLRQRMLALGIGSDVVVREVAGSLDFWLIHPVSGGRSVALAKLSELQESGIDSFLITQGSLANNLSLGVFGREDYAQARLAQLRDQGYPVRLEPVAKRGREYLVQVNSDARRLVDQALLGRLRESFPQLQHQYLPCRAVAAVTSIP